MGQEYVKSSQIYFLQHLKRTKVDQSRSKFAREKHDTKRHQNIHTDRTHRKLTRRKEFTAVKITKGKGMQSIKNMSRITPNYKFDVTKKKDKTSFWSY